VHNIIANILLKKSTNNTDAFVAYLHAPMPRRKGYIDGFEFINEEIFPLALLIIYILPINRLVRRMASNRIEGHQDLLYINAGITPGTNLLAHFLHFMIVIVLISVQSFVLLGYGGLLKGSDKGLLFLVLLLYGVSIFVWALF